MSIDPSAIIYYGFALPLELAEHSEETEGWYELSDSWEQAHQPQRPENEEYQSAEWNEWRVKNREWEKSLENVRVTFSGSDYDKTYFVHCECMKKEVEWDEQIDIPPLEPSPEADEWIRKFCEHASIAYQQPRWRLASKYY